MEHKTYREIGTIIKTKNAYSNNSNISYRVSFAPQYSNNKIKINGECKCNGEKCDFEFDYYPDTQIVIVNQDFRMYIFDDNDDETFEKYNKIIRYCGVKNTTATVIPWIRFPKSTSGVLIPLLIETVLRKMPSQINFF